MKIKLTKEWCLKMAELEGDSPISAGAYAIDPTPEQESQIEDGCEEPNIAFGRFVRLMRRNQQLTIEKLAEEADVEVTDLVEIEDDTRHRPEPRTVYRLAQFFRISERNLMQVAGLTTQRDSQLCDEAIRFAARSDPVARLTPEERMALEAFVVILNERQ